jgi:hypothetical protein
MCRRDPSATIPLGDDPQPNGPRVYGITFGHRIRLARELVLDSEYLKSFGELLVPEPPKR